MGADNGHSLKLDKTVTPSRINIASWLPAIDKIIILTGMYVVIIFVKPSIMAKLQSSGNCRNFIGVNLAVPMLFIWDTWLINGYKGWKEHIILSKICLGQVL